MRWLDVSNNQGPLSAQFFLDAKAQGYGGVVINTYGPLAVQWMLWAKDAGLEVACYVYLNFPGGQFYSGVSAHDQVTAALDKMDAAGISGEWLGIDCEDPGNNLSVAATIAFIHEATDACAGRRYSRIYTAPGWWQQFTGDTLDFQYYPLWLSNPTGAVPTSMTLPQPFGGWTTAAMIQYDFHAHVDDIEVDADETPAPPAEDEDSLADRTEVEGSQAITILNIGVSAALGRIVAGDESQGDEFFVRLGPSVDLPDDEGEIILRTKKVNIPAFTPQD